MSHVSRITPTDWIDRFRDPHQADRTRSIETSPRASAGLNGWFSVFALAVTVYVGIMEFIPYGTPQVTRTPARLLAPFRIANAYGLFAVMTTAEYEIEFQGRRGDTTWIAYPFRYKPQDPSVAPGVYAPYQPRFDWNLWFASLGPLVRESMGCDDSGPATHK